MSSLKAVPLCGSCRVSLMVVIFLACVTQYALRINISVAMVCLVVPRNSTGGSVNNTAAECGSTDTNTTSKIIGGPKVPWSGETQGTVLSSFFYGYICTQFLGGWLAGRYGGKIVFGVGMSVACVLTFLTPLAVTFSNGSPIPAIAVRAMMGVALGVIFPSIHTIWGRWAPPLERSILITFSYSGTIVGSIVGLSASGALCSQTDFANGWPSIFYVFGVWSFIIVLVWFYFVHDYPRWHPRITEEEQKYIESAIGEAAIPEINLKGLSGKGRTLPWRPMLFSCPLWAIIIGHMVKNWGTYTLMTKLPAYMNDVLQFNIKENGLLSSLPYMGMFIATLMSGQLSDYLIKRKTIRTVTARKIWQSGGFILSAACLVGVGFVGCDVRMLAVALVTLATTFTSGSRAGYQVNHVDIAPRYAGELYGITNTMATIPGMVAPIVVSYLTPNGTRDEWQIVFYLWAAIFGLGALFYGIFASGEEQDWARVTQADPTDDDGTEFSYVNEQTKEI